MNIRLVIFTIAVFFTTSVWAGAVDADKQKDAQSKEAVPDKEAVQDKEVVQVTEAAQGIDDEAEDPNEWICKRVQKTGTRFKSKMCGTRAQWEESEKRAKDVTEQMRNRPQYGKATN
jgi:hypothetical protein